MSKCNKLNCPMQYNKVSDDCDIKDCPYRTTDKIEDWETASKFLAMIFGISEEQRKEGVEKVKRDYDTVKEIAKDIAEFELVDLDGNLHTLGEAFLPYDIESIAKQFYEIGYRKQVDKR